MFKRTIFLFTLIIGVVMSSCSNNGNQAETTDAEKVDVVETNNTLKLNTVKAGSVLDWRASHLGGVQPRFGKVSIKDAAILVNNGTVTNASVAMDMSTLTVENFPEGDKSKEDLTGHLQSQDFFNVQLFPTANFEMTKLENTTGDYNSKVTGNLTILAVTKSITFNANVKVLENEVVIQSEDFSVNRTDWGLTYNTEGTAGVPVDYLIANDIGFTINLAVSK